MNILLSIILNIFPFLTPLTYDDFSGLSKALLDTAINKYEEAFERISECVNIMDAVFSTASASGTTTTVGLAGDTLFNACKSGMEAMKPVGYAMCMLFFIVALLELTTQDRMTLEFFIKFFAKLAIGVAVIYYLTDIVTTIQTFGSTFPNWIATEVSLSPGSADTFPTSEEIAETLLNGAEGSKIGIGIRAVLSAYTTVGILSIFFLVIEIVTYVIAFSRIIELNIRMIFLPIACGMLSDDGWHGGGGRYLRKYFAIVAQGGVLVLIGKVYGMAVYAVMTAGIGGTPFSGLIATIGISLAVISLMFKSMQIVSDAFGA